MHLRSAKIIGRVTDFERGMEQAGAIRRCVRTAGADLDDSKVVVIAEREERHRGDVHPRRNRQPEYALVELFRPLAVPNLQHDMSESFDLHRVAPPPCRTRPGPHATASRIDTQGRCENGTSRACTRYREVSR